MKKVNEYQGINENGLLGTRVWQPKKKQVAMATVGCRELVCSSFFFAEAQRHFRDGLPYFLRIFFAWLFFGFALIQRLLRGAAFTLRI